MTEPNDHRTRSAFVRLAVAVIFFPLAILRSDDSEPRRAARRGLADFIHGVITLILVFAFGGLFFDMSPVLGVMVWAGMIGYALFAGWRGRHGDQPAVPLRPAKRPVGQTTKAAAPIAAEPIAAAH